MGRGEGEEGGNKAAGSRREWGVGGKEAVDVEWVGKFFNFFLFLFFLIFSFVFLKSKVLNSLDFESVYPLTLPDSTK